MGKFISCCGLNVFWSWCVAEEVNWSCLPVLFLQSHKYVAKICCSPQKILTKTKENQIRTKTCSCNKTSHCLFVNMPCLMHFLFLVAENLKPQRCDFYNSYSYYLWKPEIVVPGPTLISLEMIMNGRVNKRAYKEIITAIINLLFSQTFGEEIWFFFFVLQHPMNNSRVLVDCRACSEKPIVHSEKLILVFCQKWRKLQENSCKVEERWFKFTNNSVFTTVDFWKYERNERERSLGFIPWCHSSS